jgi:ATP-dependent helicase HepA
MNSFVPGQRWISHSEAELGLGLILEASFNRVTVIFIASGERRTYASDNAPLTRVVFTIGDQVESSENQKLTVQKLSERNGLVSYHCINEQGEGVLLEEIDLNHHLQFNRPQDRFFMGQIDPARWFELRYETWLHIQRIQQSPVRGLMGGRTSLIPHQLYIAHEAASRYRLRVMLADEVGLGKTIEAGLILHHRLLNGLTRRALIIVPESLLHQWLVEMLRRFNLRFSIFDEARCLEMVEDNPFSSEQLVLCSQDFFTQQPERQQQALEAGWDMVIVDEVHHLEWSEQAVSPEYRFVEQLAELSPSLLLLSATPEQLGKESHFARLRLLDSDRFYSFEDFLKEEAEFEPVANAAHYLLDGKSLTEAQKVDLKRLLKNDDAGELLDQLNDSQFSETARDSLIKLLLDHHGTGRVLFRNSRRTVKGFPERISYGYLLACEGNPKLFDLKDDPRYGWLVEKMAELAAQKALLICADAETALKLGALLKAKTAIQSVVFHEGMSIIERDRAAAWFADEESNAQLLICSEIGSEGRNFQFAHHLVLFDLPNNPDLLQQRIGRLDRIGQTEVIKIHIPYIEGSEQAILFRWYDEVLNLFRKNSEAAQAVYQRQKEALQSLLAALDAPKVDDFIARSLEIKEQIEEEMHQGRDQLLEINSSNEVVASNLIAQLNGIEQEKSLWPYMDKLFDCYGVDVEYHSPDCYIPRPSDHLRTSHFPELPEEGLTVTVNREVALAREEMQFLTWEHPMVTAAMDLVLSSETGNAAVSVVKHDALKAGQFLIEALFIIECSAPAELQMGRFLPPTPVRVLINQANQDLTAKVSHDSLVVSKHRLDSRQLNQFVTGQKKEIESILRKAESIAKKRMAEVVTEGARSLGLTFKNELDRLARLKQVNLSIKQSEIDELKGIAELSIDQLKEARLKLDAVRLIIVG